MDLMIKGSCKVFKSIVQAHIHQLLASVKSLESGVIVLQR